MDQLLRHKLPDVVILNTPRLTLVEINTDILEHIYTRLTIEEQMTLLGHDTKEKLEKEKAKFTGGLTTYRINFQNFLLIEKETVTTIGAMGYHAWMVPCNRAEIGYALHRDKHKRKGYASEAMGAVLKYGFQQMGLNRVEAFLSPENIASKKLVEKHGFRYEGLLKEHYYNRDGYEDSACYGLLRSEYDKINK
jgi:ribosomal-protein-alanine N-acetyltransferase